MLNQVAVEALYSATYVENYLDSVDNLPDDVQRFLSRIREIDLQYNGESGGADFARAPESGHGQCTRPLTCCVLVAIRHTRNTRIHV